MISISYLAAATVETGAMGTLDMVLFLVAVIGVIAFGIWQGNKENKGEAESGAAAGYFLAGRGLTWWLVGFSLIAANISTEQFVGMSGQAADWLGMAIASYEWMAAITLVVVAFLFLPKLLRCGIYTIPEFLEYRYGVVSRTVMAISTLVILVGVPTASVIYSGAKVVSVFFAGQHVFGMDLGSITVGCWIIGLSAAAYVFVGGLKACAWTDLIWGAALIVGGAVVMWLALGAMKDANPQDLIVTKVSNSSATVADLENASGWERFMLLNDGKNGEAVAREGENMAGGKLHMVRPKSDPAIPWTALLLGLWIPNFFYWGLKVARGRTKRHCFRGGTQANHPIRGRDSRDSLLQPLQQGFAGGGDQKEPSDLGGNAEG
jgi:SSS family solute:Na+ symporter